MVFAHSIHSFIIYLFSVVNKNDSNLVARIFENLYHFTDTEVVFYCRALSESRTELGEILAFVFFVSFYSSKVLIRDKSIDIWLE